MHGIIFYMKYSAAERLFVMYFQSPYLSINILYTPTEYNFKKTCNASFPTIACTTEVLLSYFLPAIE